MSFEKSKRSGRQSERPFACHGKKKTIQGKKRGKPAANRRGQDKKKEKVKIVRQPTKSGGLCCAVLCMGAASERRSRYVTQICPFCAAVSLNITRQAGQLQRYSIV